MMEMNALRVWLDKQPPGAVAYSGELARLLRKAWDEFSGSGEEQMEGYKVLNRMEEIMWEPPVLSFTIERHGGTVMSSSRAESNRWSVDLERMTAELSHGRVRQLSRTQPRLKIEPLADDLVQRIVAGEADVRLKWLEPGGGCGF